MSSNIPVVDDLVALLATYKAEGVKEVLYTSVGFEVVVKRAAHIPAIQSLVPRYRGMPVHVKQYVPPPDMFLGVPAKVEKVGGGFFMEAISGPFQLQANRASFKGAGWHGYLHIVCQWSPMKVVVPSSTSRRVLIKRAEDMAKQFADAVSEAAARAVRG